MNANYESDKSGDTLAKLLFVSAPLICTSISMFLTSASNGLPWVEISQYMTWIKTIQNSVLFKITMEGHLFQLSH